MFGGDGDVGGSGTFELSTASADSSFIGGSKTDSTSVLLALKDDGLPVLVQIVLLLLPTLVHGALPA